MRVVSCHTEQIGELKDQLEEIDRNTTTNLEAILDDVDRINGTLTSVVQDFKEV